jgi:hypothetical protein
MHEDALMQNSHKLRGYLYLLFQFFSLRINILNIFSGITYLYNSLTSEYALYTSDTFLQNIHVKQIIAQTFIEKHRNGAMEI